MANVESLIVKLDAKIDGYLDGMDKAKKKNDDFTKSSKGMGDSILKTGAIATKGALAIGAAAVAAAAAIMATSKAVGEYAKELKIASNISGIGVEQLQLMAYATASVGINLEKLGDISKDTREKIGDFLNTGGGGFQDFADAMKLTKEETQAAANEFAVMSGPKILQEMVTRMEAANVSAVQMSHALEGMASDTTNLIPLLADGGKKMNELKIAAANVVIPLTDDDIDLFIRMGASTDLASAALKSLGEQTLINLGNTFIKVTDTIAYFFATLNKGSVTQKRSRLIEIDEEMLALKVSAENANTVFGRLKNTLSGDIYQPQFNTEKQNELLKEQWTLIDEIIKLENSAAEGKPEKLEPITSTGTGTVDQIQEIADRYKSEEELLTQKFDKELEMIGDNDELKKQRHEQYLEDLLELDQTNEDKKLNAAKIAADKITKIDTDKIKLKKSLEDSALKTSISALATFGKNSDKAAKAAFIITQGLALSEAFVNTQAASVKALTVDPTGILSAKVQAAGALSMASIAAATLGGMGGGSGGGSSTGGGGGANIQNPPLQDFEAETSGLELTDSTSSGAQTMRIEFINSTGDDIINSIAEGLNTAQREGRTS